MKKNRVITAVLTGVMTTAIAATMCATASAATKIDAQPATQTPCVSEGMPNPFIDCDSDMAQAVKKAGFTFNIPMFSNYCIIATDGIINVNVNIDEESHYTISKTKGEYEHSVGIDYTAINDARLADSDVMFAIADGKVYDAYWVVDGYTYEISCDKGMEVEHAIETVLDMMNAEATMN